MGWLNRLARYLGVDADSKALQQRVTANMTLANQQLDEVQEGCKSARQITAAKVLQIRSAHEQGREEHRKR